MQILRLNLMVITSPLLFLLLFQLGINLKHVDTLRGVWKMKIAEMRVWSWLKGEGFEVLA